jgi:cytochrome P450
LIEAARPRRRIDVVGGFARVVAVRLVASYFGIPGPDEPTMMRWMRDIFHYIFADLTNDGSVERDALNSARELRGHMDEQIALRKVELSKPKQNDDVLTRLLALEGAQNSWLDDHAVRRNLAGVIVGAVDTTSKFVTLAIDELLRRPAALAKAREAAATGDIEAVRRFAWEAVRFNPHHPLLVRYCARETRVAAGLPRSKAIPAGTFVYVATFSAMFDSEAFRNPDEFDATRTNEYLHFGHNLHSCFGRFINAVQIPELVAALLRLRNLRRTPGDAGRILYEGPFPDRLVLEFDA